VSGEQYQRLLPHNTTVCIIHVVHFIEHRELEITEAICAAVQHAPQNLSGHDQTPALRIHRHVTGQQAGIEASGAEIAVLLVANRLDRARIHTLCRSGPG
jgi:hypothetical protein